MASSSSDKTTSTISAEEEARIFDRIRAHQREAASLPPADSARTLVEASGRGVLSTVSKAFGGFPFGSPVSFAADDRGRPILSISSLSPHTADVEADPRCSLLVSKDLKVMDETVITIIGRASQVPQAEESQARDFFLKKHPQAFWVDFGDFRFVRIQPESVRYVTNVASSVGAGIAVLSGEEYTAAAVDFVLPFGGAVMNHMNADHGGETAAIVAHSIGIKVDSAKMVGVDRLGMLVEVKCYGQLMKLRIPFPRPASSRKDLKDIIVEMTQAAAASASAM